MPSQLRIGGGQPRRHVAPRPADPFAQQTPQEIQQVIGQYLARLPKPLSTGQIQTQAQGMLSPVIQRITQAINKQTAGQQQAVKGYTNTLAANLAGMAPRLAEPYQQAEAATAASSQSLADRLAGGGQAAGQDLQSRLASINAPGAVDPAVQAAQQSGAGAGNSLYASGNAALQQLIANGASAAGYGAKLPGIARLGGIQQAGLVGQQGATGLAKGIADVEGQLPGIVGNLQTMSGQRASDRASLGADLYKTLTGQNITRATAKAGLASDQTSARITAAKASQPTYVGSSGTGYYAVDPNTGQPIQQVVPAAPKTPPTPKVVGSDKTGRYQLNPDGTKTLITPPVKLTPAEKKRAKGPQLTASSVQKYRGVAEQIAENARHGFDEPLPTPTSANPNPTAKHHPAIGYDAAFNEMLKAGVPQNIAIQALNRWYPKGDRSVNPAVNPGAAGPANPAFG